MLLPFSNLATERGCRLVNIFIGFLVSVAAGVATNYISKWLDWYRNRKGK